ncbi:craniofacial development protein 2-like [Diadema setosum]|uniref:craniofacial development protein 2-like n=1 Tax=Diadema setosum TaxID=31175 RepID=UPI003B3B010D
MNTCTDAIRDNVLGSAESSTARDSLDHHHATMHLKSKKRIGTWNVRSLYQAGKLANVVLEMKRLKLDVLGMSEVRWPQAGKIKVDGYTMVYSGNRKAHINGVGILMSNEIASAMAGFYAVSERVIVLQVNSKPFNCNIIQLYAPTSACTEDGIEEFYESVEEAYRQCKPGELNIVMGDMNAKVGHGRDGTTCEHDVLGPYGLGERNERGERWIQWCMVHQQVIKNTWFKQPKRRLYTWCSPGDGVRNQIDYITINRRFHSWITATKTYPGADCGSDHVPVICNLRLKINRPAKRNPSRKPRRRFDLLRTDPAVADQYRKRVGELLNKESTSD